MEFKKFLLLLAFTTRLPVKIPNYDVPLLGNSIKYFPMVGLVLGLINLCIFYLLEPFFSASILAVIIMLVDVLLTGGLHLDGLADTFDGVFSYRPRERVLEIMKDPHVGTNGILTLLFYFLLKFALLLECMIYFREDVWIFIILPCIIARLMSLFNATFWVYAKDSGLGKSFVDYTKGKDFFMSYVWVCILLLFFSFFSLVSFFSLFLVLNGVLFFAWYFARRMTKALGGSTGDTLGAQLELSSLFTLLLLYMVY